MTTSKHDPLRRGARRADAQRNRDFILSAAREVFAGADADASMAEISRRAGVGMATLYRNFPSRRELLEALYAAEVDAVCDAAIASDDEPPGIALRAWLGRFFVFIASKKHLAAELLTHVERDSPVFDDNRARILSAGRPLFEAARDVGQVRADLTFEQALDMLVSIATIDRDPGYREPILQTILDGLIPLVPAGEQAAPVRERG